jgi:hypothetical protein
MAYHNPQFHNQICYSVLIMLHSWVIILLSVNNSIITVVISTMDYYNIPRECALACG